MTENGAGSAWAPFRERAFAAIWTALFVSNSGSWMQTVGAQWLMLSLTISATYIALVQTASSLPVVFFGAGRRDRRPGRLAAVPAAVGLALGPLAGLRYRPRPPRRAVRRRLVAGARAPARPRDGP